MAGLKTGLPFIVAVLILTLLISTASAEKFKSWFYWYDRPAEPTLSTLETTTCRQSFDSYRSSSLYGKWNDQVVIFRCYIVVDCMLSNMRASFMANYQAAAVMLGFTPTLIASLGPRIGEISLLSTTRPGLSFLISIGAPAIWPTRVFDYDDPSSTLGRGMNKRVLGVQPPGRATLISALEYLIVCGAIFNLFHVAVVLGQKTVLTWSCQFDWGPLAWGLIPVFIHVITAFSYHLEVRTAENRAYKRRRNSEVRITSTSVTAAPVGAPSTRFLAPQDTVLKRSMKFSWSQQELSASPDQARDLHSFRASHPQSLVRRHAVVEERKKLSWWRRELTICANQPRGLPSLLKETRFSTFTTFMNCFASVLAFFHLFFGTVMFSSLIFISVYDFMNFVFWRYFLSTLLCKLVLMTELAGMRTERIEDLDEEWDDMDLAMQSVKLHNSSPRVSTWPTSGSALKKESETVETKNRATSAMEQNGARQGLPYIPRSVAV